jgi:hypothetical protein
MNGEGGGGIKLSTIILLAAAAAAGWFLWRKYAAAQPSAGPTVQVALQPGAITLGQNVSADSYRLIAAKRAGMTYAQVSGTLGSTITFIAPKTGQFTRNLVQVGGAIFAEVA